MVGGLRKTMFYILWRYNTLSIAYSIILTVSKPPQNLEKLSNCRWSFIYCKSLRQGTLRLGLTEQSKTDLTGVVTLSSLTPW